MLVDALAGTGTVPEIDEEPPGTDPSWSGVSLRAPDSNYDPDAAPFRDAMLEMVARKKEREAAGLPEPPRPPRPVPPTGDAWRKGADALDAVRRGMRVFHDWFGLGTVLSVVPQHHKSEALVRFDSGAESWCVVASILVEVQEGQARP